MTPEEFEEKIAQELGTLNETQIGYFAWRCALRSFPFLVSDNDFWLENNRQNHLYAIFYALDESAFLLDRNSGIALVSDVTLDIAVAKVADVIVSAKIAAKAIVDRDSFNSIATTSSIFLRETADQASYDANEADKKARDARNTAIKAAFNSARGAILSSIKSNTSISLEALILDDFSTIKKGQSAQHTSTKVYGEIWNNFLSALKSEGCEYWGKLYEDIFEKGFKLDKDALKERLMNVPESIQVLGASEVASYLDELKKGATRLNEARIIILGDKGAGKTCLARRLKEPNAPMTSVDDSTAGVDTLIWELEGNNINVRIWDFAGHTVTHAVHRFFLSERCLYIVVYDGRSEVRNQLEYWLNHMKNYGGDSKAMILVNVYDNHRVDIPINRLKEKYPIEGFFEFSIQDDEEKLEEFRNSCACYIKNNPSWNNQKIPVSNYYVKEKLEKFFAKCEKGNGKEHITKQEFTDIAKKYGVENTEELLIRLNALGISLWYKEMDDFNTLVLNPEWISHGVYKIINWANNNKKYSVTLREFRDVFKIDLIRYPKDKHMFLFKLMKYYELAYVTEKGRELIIPHLLKEDQPIQEKIPSYPIGESLILRYKAELPLPPDTISRFIVRHNKQIKKDKEYLVWRYGVILEDKKGSTALVREDDRTISVSVKGYDKTNYISELRKTLDNIFNSYKSERPEIQYWIERHGLIPDELDSIKPLWLPGRKIKNLVEKNSDYFDDETGHVISMKDVVNIYNIRYKIVKKDVINYSKNSDTKIIFDNSITNQGDSNTIKINKEVIKYTPYTWERILAYVAASLLLVIFIFLLFQGKPFSDPNLVVIARIFTSFVISLFGATIPGFVNIGLDRKGITIRAGGAIALFILTYFFTPKVL